MAKSKQHSKRNLFFGALIILALPLIILAATTDELNELRGRAAGCPSESVLLKTYNIRVTGVKICERKDLILEVVSGLYSQPGFKERMGVLPLEFRNVIEDKYYWGYVTNKGLIKLSQFDKIEYGGRWKFIIAHELFHVFSLRKPETEQAYNIFYPTLASLDWSCFRDTSKGKVIKTYALETPSNAKHESFAESGALYFLNQSRFNNKIPSFRDQCPNTYLWFQQNIFTVPTPTATPTVTLSR